MNNINIKKQTSLDHGWSFVVSVDKFSYEVEVEKDYWQELTKGLYPAAQLVKESFKFLLSREPKEMIMKKFNLRLISQYFPDYEKELRKY